MIEHNLCKEYPALTPWELDNETFHRVIKLFVDVKKMRGTVQKATDPDRPIKKKAGDDWF